MVVGSVLALFMLITGIALFFNRGSGSPLASPPSKRFTAKSGTTRDRAVALVSKKQTARIQADDSASKDQGKREEKQRRIRARMLSEEEETRPMTETQRRIREALNTLDPEEGLQKLQALLEETRDDRERSEICAAMAELHLQRDKPDITAAEKMLDAALSAAPDAETRSRILLRQAELCAARGAPDLALAKIQMELRLMGGAESNPAAFPLLTAQGFLLESMGKADEAETVYRDVISQAGKADADASRENVREAGMRLTRLLRERQRDAEADEVARQVASVMGGGVADLIPASGSSPSSEAGASDKNATP